MKNYITSNPGTLYRISMNRARGILKRLYDLKAHGADTTARALTVAKFIADHSTARFIRDTRRAALIYHLSHISNPTPAHRARLEKLTAIDNRISARPAIKSAATVKAYKALTTHREKFPAIDTRGIEYLPARTALAMVIRSAETRRHVDPARNPYRDPIKRPDFLQIAALEYQTAVTRSTLRAVTLSDGRTVYNFNELNPVDCKPLTYAARAIERAEYQSRARRIVYKDGEATAAAPVDECIRAKKPVPEIPEHDIDRAFNAKAFQAAMINAIKVENRLSEKRRAVLIDIVKGKQESTPRDRDYLRQIGLNAGLVKRGIGKHLLIND